MVSVTGYGYKKKLQDKFKVIDGTYYLSFHDIMGDTPWQKAYLTVKTITTQT